MTIAEEIAATQKRITELKEKKAKAVQDWINMNVFSLDDSAKNAIKDTGVELSDKAHAIFKQAKKLQGPTGIFSYFMKQSHDEILKLKELMVDLRGELAVSMRNMKTEFDQELIVAQAKLRGLAVRAETERRMAEAAAREHIRTVPLRQQTPMARTIPTNIAPPGYNPRRAPQAPVYNPRAATPARASTVSSTTTNTYVDNSRNDDGSGFMTGLIVGEMLSNDQPSSVMQGSGFQSGQGGDFGGGGATGSWAPAASDDLGASSFS